MAHCILVASGDQTSRRRILPPPPGLPSTLPPPPPDGPATVPVTAAVELAKLYSTIRRKVGLLLKSDPIADDVTQEAAIRVLTRIDRFRPPPGVDKRQARRNWAARVALHVVQEWWAWSSAKKRSGEVLADPSTLETASRESSAESAIIGQETLRELESATTPERWRAFYMLHVEGYSASQIAAEVGAPVGTVYTWTRAAAEDIRAFLARRAAAERGSARPLK